MPDNKEHVFVWEVIGSKPETEHHLYPSYSNLKFAVVARTMERVMIISRETYPDVRFHSIQKRNFIGKESVLIDWEVKNG